MTERRKHKRVKMVLPVKVTAVNRTELAYTMDIAYAGARLGRIRAQLRPGDEISLARGSDRAKFRIVWVVQQLGTNEFQAGIEALQPNERFLGLICPPKSARQRKMSTC